MTELEKHLVDGLQKLAKQYEGDMKRLEAQNVQLHQHVQTMFGQMKFLTKTLENLNARLDELCVD